MVSEGEGLLVAMEVDTGVDMSFSLADPNDAKVRKN